VSTTVIVTPEFVVYDTLNNPHVIPAVTKTTTVKYKVDERLGGYYAVFFLKNKWKPVTWKLYAAYGQNIFDLTMLGGYAISSISDPAIRQNEYTPFNTVSGWTELMTNGKKVQFGIFAGYTQNMGTSENVLDYSTTNRGPDIQSVYRISPRVILIAGKFQFMVELESTTARYADKDAKGAILRDSKGVITQSTPATNLRAILAVMYSF
jgi:hypothetical protein